MRLEAAWDVIERLAVSNLAPGEATRLNRLAPIQDLLTRLSSYSGWVVGLELLLIGLVVWVVLRFVQGTRAAGALKGMIVVLLVGTAMARLMIVGGAFPRLAYMYDGFVALVAITIVVVFQPELRRALIRLGETPLFRSSPTEIVYTVDAIVEASAYLAKAKFGAIIVIERRVGLSGLIEGGTRLNAEVSSRLLQSIFFPGAALHDLAVVIRGKVVVSAGVQLPLADPADMPDPRLGSRHRAALGLTKECDALVVIVSEETGLIRLAERGKLSAGLTGDELREALVERLEKVPPGRAHAAGDDEDAAQVVLEEQSPTDDKERRAAG